MQVQEEAKKGVVLWDRVVSISRTKESGEVVWKGNVGGGNIVRIVKRDHHGFYIRGTCSSAELLNANVTQWPSDVTEDGLTISLWLIDYSMGRNGTAKRKFQITFFDEYSSKQFFETYVSCLPPRQQRKGGKSFEDFVYPAANEDDDEDDDDGNSSDKEEEDGKKENSKDGTGGGVQDEEEEGRNKVFGFLFEGEENWGHSQNLFVPSYPHPSK